MKASLLALTLALLLAACRTVRYVPVETTRTDSVYVMDSSAVSTVVHYKDSLRIKDSIVVVVDTAGNVLSKEKYHDETRAKDTKQSSSEASAKAKEAKSSDNVQVPVPVEKPLGWWERTRLKAFWWLVGAVAALCFTVAWLARMARKK